MVQIIAEAQPIEDGLYADVLQLSDGDIYFMVEHLDKKTGYRFFLLDFETYTAFIRGDDVIPTDWGVKFRTEAEYCAWINRNAA